MKITKTIQYTVGLCTLVAAFVLPHALNAQVVSSPYYTSPTGYCVTISNYLSYGSRDGYTAYSSGDVSRYQNFLISKGYLTGTPTGYFGSATYAATINFQRAYGITPTGAVGPLTRSEIYTVSCSTAGSPISQNGLVTISSITPTYVSVGSQVTIYGTSFTSTGNAIYLNGNLITTQSSYDGRTLTFTVPSQFSSCTTTYCLNSIRYIGSGTYSVYVTNAYGTSNTVSLTISGNGNGGGYNYGNAPVINNIQAPTSLSVGQTGTWTVNATDQYNQYNQYNQSLTYSVSWGDQNNYGYVNCPAGYICTNNASASNYGQTSTFTHSYQTAGTYTATFTVTNSSGQSAQTSATVTVGGNCSYNTVYPYTNYNNNCCTYNCGYNNGTPAISSVSPTFANIGSQVTIYGSGFTSTGNSVLFGQGAINNISSYDGRTLTFSIPSYLTAYCTPGYACSQIAYPVTNGTYGLSVRNANGTSNQINFTVGYGNGNTGSNISSLSPNSGPVNSQVTVYGSGFSSSATVHFGSSVINNIYSNGNSLTFYVPSQQACTYQSSGGVSSNCGIYYQPTTNGTYQVYVTDQYGTQQSNSISFTVTGSTGGSNSYINLTSMTNAPRIGSTVTVYGTGFDYSGNSVYIDGTQVASNIYSNSNGYIQFTLPQYAGSEYLYPASSHQLTVKNQSGYTSNSLSFYIYQSL